MTQTATASDSSRPPRALYIAFDMGRDGFRFARWLESNDVRCLVIDPCSILVDRKAKQRKNDAIDPRALLDLLVRHVTGDRTVTTVAVPPPDAEYAGELGRLLHRLGRVRRSLPLVAFRQWVLTVPFDLRYLLTWNGELGTAVLNAFLRALALCRTAPPRAGPAVPPSSSSVARSRPRTPRQKEGTAQVSKVFPSTPTPAWANSRACSWRNSAATC